MKFSEAVTMIVETVAEMTADLSFDELKKATDIAISKMSEEKREQFTRDFKDKAETQMLATVILAGALIVAGVHPAEFEKIVEGLKNERN